MAEDLLPSLFPRRWVAEPPQYIINYIIVDWLYREVDSRIEEKLPLLGMIHGYRNIEVYGYLQDTRISRELKYCLMVYGSHTVVENIHMPW
jgi:hypothetical protein